MKELEGITINWDFVKEDSTRFFKYSLQRPHLSLSGMIDQARRIMAIQRLSPHQTETFDQLGAPLPEEKPPDHDENMLLRAISIIIQTSPEHNNLEGGERQKLEGDNLRKWAEGAGLLLPSDQFTAVWKQQGGIAGMEHQVVFDHLDYSAKKRKLLWHEETWSECLVRIVVHNYLFPNSAYRLRGFTTAVDANGKLQFMVRVDQPFIEGRSASLAEIKPYMTALGFSKISETFGGEWADSQRKIMIMDLNRQNVLVTPEGQIVVVDPRIVCSGIAFA